MNESNDPILITFKELRQAVGWLGILLPFVLSIGLLIMNCCSIQDSISQYYYTRMGSYLTGTLCAVGLFLFAYKGYPGDSDGRWCNFAAICALGVAFIPMQLNPADVDCSNCIVYFTNGTPWWRVFHFISAALFFITLAYISLCKFTKSNKDSKDRSRRKHSRNLLYRICGITIFSCILVLAVYHIIGMIKPEYKVNRLTFFMESIMLFAFGTAWLVKGEGLSFLNDN